MEIYNPDGYVNIPEIVEKGYPFIFIIGGRATGKTYSSLLYAINSGRRFMLLRRTQTQIDLICKTEFSPFKSINRDQKRDILPKAISRYNVGFFDEDNAIIGYGAALSTFSSLRGFDSSDIDLLIYDEFIPERHERPIKGEGEAFANVMETIGRNREIQGGKPLQVLCLANSNDLGNPIFQALNLVTVAQRMKQKRKNVYANGNRGVLMIMLDNSPISKQKEKTSLYKLMKDTEFSEMALGNKFIGDDLELIKSMPIVEYKPIAAIGPICVYEHKTRRGIYISGHRSGSPPEYGTGNAERARFIRDYGDRLRRAYMRKEVRFETYHDQKNFESFI